MNIVEVSHIKKSFGQHVIFDDFSFSVKQEEFLGISGKSGTGKSTLLNMIGLLDKPDTGEITLFGEQSILPFSRKAEKFLKFHIGYLFQNFALLENETVYYNMNIAVEYHKIDNKKEKIKEALEMVGLSGYDNKKIYECSGGEQQRIAIARLLIKPCELVLADEPTGSLDSENKKLVFSLLKKLQDMGKTLIVVSHDEDLLRITDRIIYLNQ